MVSNGDAVFVLQLSSTAEGVPDAYRDLSPISHVAGMTAPFFIFRGTNDEFVCVRHTPAA
jgi:dipeptidyl aminopeptidase/acylaminoacyl peptidase